MTHMTDEERAAIAQRLTSSGPIEQALEETSALLSDLSGAAGIVMVPKREPRLAQVRLMRIAPGRALAVLVGEDGAVENRLFDIAPDDAPLDQAANYLQARMTGRTLSEAAAAIAAEIAGGKSALDAASAELVRRGLAVWSADAAQDWAADTGAAPAATSSWD